MTGTVTDRHRSDTRVDAADMQAGPVGGQQ